MDSSDIIRSPIEQTVSYAVQGLPDIPGHLTGWQLTPTEISFVYVSAPGKQRGRVQSYVKGWWTENGERRSEVPDTESFEGDMAQWPAWLADIVWQWVLTLVAFLSCSLAVVTMLMKNSLW